MNITTRKATAADAGLIADLSRRTFYETFAAQNTAADMDKFMSEQFTREALMAEVGAAGNIFLLAGYESEWTGYARLREKMLPGADGLPAMEIARIYVLKQFIGKGVGKALMQACIDEAKARPVQLIWLGVWEKNETAIRFYESWGFEKCGEQEFLLGNDLQIDWVMKKILPA